MNIREMQRPLKKAYRETPDEAKVTLRAQGGTQDSPLSCSVDIGRAVLAAGAHAKVGGSPEGACSGDLLLGALAACAQITVQMVAAAMELPVTNVQVVVEGDLDMRGTLGIDPDVPVGFEAIRTHIRVEGDLTDAQRSSLMEKSEKYCVVLSTLKEPPPLATTWA